MDIILYRKGIIDTYNIHSIFNILLIIFILFQDALGDVVYAELPAVGTEVKIKGIQILNYINCYTVMSQE